MFKKLHIIWVVLKWEQSPRCQVTHMNKRLILLHRSLSNKAWISIHESGHYLGVKPQMSSALAWIQWLLLLHRPPTNKNWSHWLAEAIQLWNKISMILPIENAPQGNGRCLKPITIEPYVHNQGTSLLYCHLGHLCWKFSYWFSDVLPLDGSLQSTNVEGRTPQALQWSIMFIY